MNPHDPEIVRLRGELDLQKHHSEILRQQLEHVHAAADSAHSYLKAALCSELLNFPRTVGEQAMEAMWEVVKASAPQGDSIRSMDVVERQLEALAENAQMRELLQRSSVHVMKMTNLVLDSVPRAVAERLAKALERQGCLCGTEHSGFIIDHCDRCKSISEYRHHCPEVKP